MMRLVIANSAIRAPRAHGIIVNNYPENSKFYDKTNKKIIGKFKDEAAGEIFTQFIGLRSKMYSYVKQSNENCKTAKGIKKIVIKRISNT